MHRALILALLAAALLLTSCAPVAAWGRDLIDTTDGATLSYVQRADDQLPGLRFDPADQVALAVIIVARGSDLQLLAYPDGADCTATSTTLDCRLGDVSAATDINLTGRQVIASATWRRDGSTRVLQTFAR